MAFLKKSTFTQQPESVQPRKFTPMQYIAAVAAMSLSVTAISYAAANLTIFSTGPISASAINDNFAKLEAEIRSNQVPAGTLVAFSGVTAPAGYIQCPTTPTAVSRTAYAALFAAVGTTWGSGDGATTFGVPWFQEGYSLLQSNATTPNVGTQSVGEVISHTHRPVYGGTPSNTTVVYDNTVNQGLGAGASGMGAHVLTIESTGGAANLAAGTKVMILVKL